MYLKRLLAFLCCFTLVFCLFPSSAFATGGNGNIDGGGGSMGHGTSSNFWNSGNDGVRITVVDASSGTAVSSPLDFSNRTQKTSGNYFPKNHINPYIGLKFPWLFNDEEGWYKTHRLGSYTWILAGIVSILHPLHNLVFVTVPLIIFLVGVVPLVYSLVLYFKRKRSN